MPELPYGTPKVLPVDDDYRVTPAARAAVARRMRQHGFDIVAPEVTAVLDGAWERVDARAHHELRFVARRPRRLRPGQAVELPLPPDDFAWVSGDVEGGGARVVVAGERLPRTRAAARRRLASGVYGSPIVIGGVDGARVAAVQLCARRARPVCTVDRFPIHEPLRVGHTLRVPLARHRRGQTIEQVAVHWGSVEYRLPDRTRPLVAWGYPYYVDGVLGDVGLVRDERERRLATGKFLEFDELENIRCPRGARGDVVTVTLRARDERVPSPVCRVAAVTVRYRTEVAPAERFEVDRWVKPGRSLALRSRARRVARVDVAWADRGPAMGAVAVGGARAGWVNVCSGERFAFPFGWCARAGKIAVHATGAALHVSEAFVYEDDG